MIHFCNVWIIYNKYTYVSNPKNKEKKTKFFLHKDIHHSPIYIK